MLNSLSFSIVFGVYVDDIFSLFQGAYVFCVSVLIHAADATLIAESRELAISKLRSLLYYCNLNKIITQYTKCNFIVINGEKEDKLPLPFGNACEQHRLHFTAWKFLIANWDDQRGENITHTETVLQLREVLQLS